MTELNRPKQFRPRKWMDADREHLIALLESGLPVAVIAQTLKRSLAAIKVQATKQRISASGNVTQRQARSRELNRGHQ